VRRKRVFGLMVPLLAQSLRLVIFLVISAVPAKASVNGIDGRVDRGGPLTREGVAQFTDPLRHQTGSGVLIVRGTRVDSLQSGIAATTLFGPAARAESVPVFPLWYSALMGFVALLVAVNTLNPNRYRAVEEWINTQR
jgi:hypothetical protein